LHIVFPGFRTNAILGTHDIYINAVPDLTTKCSLHIMDTLDQTVSSSVCCEIKQFSNEVHFESEKVDNLLTTLGKCYQDIKTKCPLNLEVPDGFCQDNNFQRMIQDATLLNTTTQPLDLLSSLDIDMESTTDTISTDQHSSELSSALTSGHDNISQIRVPILRCIDKPSSSLTSKLTLNEDFICASVGFHRIDSIKRQLSDLYQDTDGLDSLPRDAILDQGDLATLWKSPRNTTPVPRPLSFGDVIHTDIVFGPEVALTNVHCGLLFTDTSIHYKILLLTL
jgi:hypothetical protein